MDLLKYLKLALAECRDTEVSWHIRAAIDTYEKKRLWYSYRWIERGSGTCISQTCVWEIRNVAGVVRSGETDIRNPAEIEKELDKIMRSMV